MPSSGWLPITMAILVILAGCSSGTPPSGPTPTQDTTEAVTVTTEAANTQTPTQTGVPSIQNQSSSHIKAANSSNLTTINSSLENCTSRNGTIFCNMTPDKAAKIRNVTTSTFENLPSNRTERLALTARVARSSCRELPRIPSVQTLEKQGGVTKRQLYRVKHAAKTLQVYNDQIDPQKVQTAIDTAGTVAKYATVIGSYRQYRKAACAFNRSKPETVQDYYIATAAVTVELAMLQYGVAYKVSSKATRMASHTSTFRMVQSKFGDDALRVLMSETHWAFRGQVAGVQTAIATELDQRNITLDNTTVNKTEFRQRLNRTGRLLNQTSLNETINNSSGVVNQTQEIVNNSSIKETANKTDELRDRVEQLWNESNPSEKADCLRTVGGSLAANLLKQVANPLEEAKSSDLFNLSNDKLRKLGECLSEGS